MGHIWYWLLEADDTSRQNEAVASASRCFLAAEKTRGYVSNARVRGISLSRCFGKFLRFLVKISKNPGKLLFAVRNKSIIISFLGTFLGYG